MKSIFHIPVALVISLVYFQSCSSQDNDIARYGAVTSLTTSADLGCDLTATQIEFNKGESKSRSLIIVLPETRYQEIDGFGAAITGATAFNLMKMKPHDRKKFLLETFSDDEGYGMSYVRVCIGCSDFSLSDYTCCDSEGIENFSLTDEETQYVIPSLKEIIAINPRIKILASPWTAPRWMKVNNLQDRKPHDRWTGGHLNPDHYQDYAEYFARWIKAMEREGINIYAMTPQNEPLHTGNSASMFMGWDEQRDFVKQALGPKLRAEGISTKIYVFDHNYNYDNIESQYSYPTKIYADTEAAGYIAGAAYHNYGGNYNELNNIHAANPEKELVFTESTAGDWNDGANLKKRLVDDMEQITLGTVNRWCRGAIIWNLMLDSNRGPNRPGGCTNGFGAVDIAADYKTIRRNSYYYIMAHMSSVVKPGAVRIASNGISTEGLTFASFLNPDGSYALVVCNRNDRDKTVGVSDRVNNFDVTIPGNGIVSLRWVKG